MHSCIHFFSDVLDTVNFLPYSILHREQKQSPIVLQAHGLWLFIPLNHTLDKDPCLQMCGLSSELNCRVERSAYSLLCCTEFIYPRMNKNWHRFQKKHFGKILIFSNIIVRGKIWKFDFRFKICRCSKIFTDLYFLSVNCTFHLFSSRRFYFILLINNIIVKLNTKKKIKYCSETFERSEEIWRNMNMYISIYEIWRKLIKSVR